jgi:hypothetical protein
MGIFPVLILYSLAGIQANENNLSGMLITLIFKNTFTDIASLNQPDATFRLIFALDPITITKNFAKFGKRLCLPPSIHPDGHTYQWLGTGSPLDIPYIPMDLLNVWKLLIASKSRIANRKRSFATNYSPPPETPRQIATIQAALCHINADCDYETWRNIVWAILSTGWLCAEDIALAWSQTAQNRFEDDAFWLVANSYIPDLKNQITVGSIYFHARNGGWNG